MTSAFLDTSGWFAALRPQEAMHREAAEVYRDWSDRRLQLVTTNLVVAEMHILLARARGTATALEFLDRLHADPTHEVVYVDRPLERDAIDRWMRRFGDQRLSLADVTSFEVMRVRQVKRVLALDEHFTLAGFERAPA